MQHTQQTELEALEERAAIMEFEGGLSRKDAERIAASPEQWNELESLLAIVGPAYNTPAHEYAEIQLAASADLTGALIAYRSLAAKVNQNNQPKEVPAWQTK